MTLGRIGFRPVKCVKCSFRFFRWSLKWLSQRNKTSPKVARGARERPSRWSFSLRRSFSWLGALPTVLGSIVLLAAACTAGVMLYDNSPAIVVSDHRTDPLNSPPTIDTTGLQISIAFADMEGANRGFLMSGDPVYRDAFLDSRNQFSAGYKLLLKEFQGDAEKTDQLHRIKSKLDVWFKLYNPLIQERRRNPGAKPNPTELHDCRLAYAEIRRDLANLPGGASARS